MSLLVRLVVIFFGFLAASLAAGLVLALGLLLPEWRDFAGPEFDGGLSAVVVVSAVLISGFALIPTLLVVVVAEALRLRSALFYAAAGAAVAVLSLYGFEGIADPLAWGDAVARSELQLVAAAGIVAGFVYWALAGRNAGRWRGEATV